MDRLKWMEQGKAMWRKYRYVLLVVALGLLLMLLPERKNTQESVPQPEAAESRDLSEDLEQILSLVQGAGKVRVLLPAAQGERIEYQTDYDSEGDRNSLREDTVIITDSSRNQSGLVSRIYPPVYQGAVVLCQGADSASVRLAITEAVEKATGLPTDRITVLKMK